MHQGALEAEAIKNAKVGDTFVLCRWDIHQTEKIRVTKVTKTQLAFNNGLRMVKESRNIIGATYSDPRIILPYVGTIIATVEQEERRRQTLEKYGRIQDDLSDGLRRIKNSGTTKQLEDVVADLIAVMDKHGL